jgi:hypothetical protein
VLGWLVLHPGVQRTELVTRGTEDALVQSRFEVGNKVAPGPDVLRAGALLVLVMRPSWLLVAREANAEGAPEGCGGDLKRKVVSGKHTINGIAQLNEHSGGREAVLARDVEATVGGKKGAVERSRGMGAKVKEGSLGVQVGTPRGSPGGGSEQAEVESASCTPRRVKEESERGWRGGIWGLLTRIGVEEGVEGEGAAAPHGGRVRGGPD